MSYNRPLPQTTPWTRPFWDGLQQKKLMIQKCSQCAGTAFYPKLFCPSCYAESLDWVEAEGEWEIYSYTIVQQHPPSAFRDDLPYVVAIVRIPDGPQLMTNVIDCEPEQVACGMKVVPTFDDVTDDFTLVKFRPAG